MNARRGVSLAAAIAGAGGGGISSEGRRAGQPAGDPCRPGQEHDQPEHLRPFLRAPRPLHLRGHLGGRGQPDPQHARHPQRRRAGAQEEQDSRPPLAGRLLRRRVPLDGRHRPAGEAPDHDQHPLGRRHGEQPLRHPRVPRPLRAARLRALHLRQRRQRHGPRDAAVGRVHDLRRRQPDGRPAQAERPREALEADVLRRRQRELGLRRLDDARVLRRPVSALRAPTSATSATTTSSRSPAAPTATTSSGPRC